MAAGPGAGLAAHRHRRRREDGSGVEHGPVMLAAVQAVADPDPRRRAAGADPDLAAETAAGGGWQGAPEV